MEKSQAKIEVFTDGSFDPKWKIGGWAALIFASETEILLNGHQKNGSQHLMELFAVVESLKYLRKNNLTQRIINLYTDSQYVFDLMHRRKKLEEQRYMSKAGNPIVHQNLIQKYYKLMDQLPARIQRLPSHQKQNTGYDNQRRVDKIARQIVRKKVKEFT